MNKRVQCAYSALLISRIFLIRESRENKKVMKISGFTVYYLIKMNNCFVFF